jgi:ABC-type multidrug transport system fused ATPase/permease subunit
MEPTPLAYDADYTAGLGHQTTVRLLGFVAPYQRPLLLALVLVVISSAASLAQPYLIKVAIDDGVAQGNYERLTFAAVAIAVSLIVFAITNWAQTLLMSWVGQRLLLDVRTRLFTHLQSLSMDFFDRESLGRIISRLTSDVSALNEVLTQGLVGSIADLVVLVGIVATMLHMSPRLTVLTFVMIPPMMIAARYFTVASRDAYRRVRLAIADLNSSLAEDIVGMRVIQAFRREDRNRSQFEVVNAALLASSKRSVMISASVMPGIDVFQAVGAALVLWFGGRWVLGENAGEMTVGVLTAFILYVERFFEPIRELMSRYDTLQAATAAGERIFQMLDTKPRIVDRPDAKTLERVQGGVRISEVTFGYDPSEPVLEAVTIEAASGQRIALVGETGAGKSTIARLIARFYDPQHGSVTLDGHDVRDLTIATLRRHVASVPQDPFLFTGTIADNLLFGRPDATRSELTAVAHAIGLDVALAGLPAGYETPVEERGSNLSVGQRQLISIGRALLTDPAVLILDEATSSVDTATEHAVQRGLASLLAGRTCFIIAHRLATIRDADRIVVLRSGRVVEQGTHLELLARQGYYADLHQRGFPDSEDADLGRSLRSGATQLG